MKKHVTLTLWLFFWTLVLTAQVKEIDHKSHFLNTNIIVCPIDYSKLYSESGIVVSNDKSLGTKQRNTSSGGHDTIFKLAFIMKPPYAFNIVDSFGSFTVIQFWELSGNGDIPTFDDLENASIDGLIAKKTIIGSLGDKPNWKFFQSRKESDNLTNNSSSSTHNNKERNIGGDLKNQGKSINQPKDSSNRTDNQEVSKEQVTKEIQSNNSYTKYKEYDLSKFHYLVKTKDLISKSTEFVNKKGTVNLGLLFLPIKVRPFATEKGQFDFTDGFSAGTSLSYCFNHRWDANKTWSYILYTGVSSYTADSSKIKEKRNDYKIPTFSTAFGFMYERNRIQFSILSGFDFPSGNIQKTWVYRNKPWLGVGIGFGLFKIDSTNSNKQENKQ